MPLGQRLRSVDWTDDAVSKRAQRDGPVAAGVCAALGSLAGATTGVGGAVGAGVGGGVGALLGYAYVGLTA